MNLKGKLAMLSKSQLLKIILFIWIGARIGIASSPLVQEPSSPYRFEVSFPESYSTNHFDRQNVLDSGPYR